MSVSAIEARVRGALEDRAAGAPVPEQILASDPMEVVDDGEYLA